MKKTLRSLFLSAALFGILSTQIFAQKPALPSMTVPDGLGYNIHFTDAKPGELEQLAASGATIVRMDFSWGGTEREKGVYDFSAFERLTDSLEKHKIRPLYILDYSNRFYDEGLSPHSGEGRAAFAKWAAAAAVHFKDRGIIWEMYNEPNIGFWRPKPDAEKYILLALEAGRAIRSAVPNEIYIGPATSEIDLTFLEQCFKAGLLEYWDAVSVHPYRQSNPETVIVEYAKLRYLIDKYAPAGKKIPILSAEWGYSTVWNGYDDVRQGKYLPRQWMVNLAADVPVSIWYDWHDDGKDPKEPEHHFGTTNNDYKNDQTPVYEPKPSYIAAKTFNETFKGFWLNKRIWTGNPDEYVFLFDFDDGRLVKLAAWTTAKEPKTITIPSSPGKFGVVSYLGEKLDDLTADEKGLTLTVSDGPVYLTPETQNRFWLELSEWLSFPIDVYGSTFQTRAKTQSKIYIGQIPLGLFSKGISKTEEKEIQGKKIVQKMNIHSENSASVCLPIPVKDELVTKIVNPNGNPIEGKLLITGDVKHDKATVAVIHPIEGLELAKTTQEFMLKQGEKEISIRIPIQSSQEGNYKFSVMILTEPINATASNKSNKLQYKYSENIFPYQTMRLVDDFSSRNDETLSAAWGIHPDGDAKVGSEQKIEAVDGLVKITYKFNEGWKFIRLAPKDELAKIEGKPKALGVQLDGDGSGNSVNIRYIDSKGQTFQVHGGQLKDKTPYYFEFPLDGTNATHWGGPNDGQISYPIRLDSILIDGTRQACGPYSVTVASPVLICE